MRKISDELFVVKRIHDYLMSNGLKGKYVRKGRLFVDPWKDWVDEKKLRPFQRFYLKYGNFTRHPDIVGQLMSDETFAVEVKGDVTSDKGLIQSQFYQYGFNFSYLGLMSRRLDDFIETHAESTGIGIILVEKNGRVDEHISPKHSVPFSDLVKSIERQFSGKAIVERWRANKYNLPMHYLATLHFIDDTVSIKEMTEIYHEKYYETPKDVGALLPTLVDWGLLCQENDTIRITSKGKTVRSLISGPQELARLTELRKDRKKRIPLSVSSPRDSSILRMILLDDPIVKLIISAIMNRGNDTPLNMYELAAGAIEEDQDLTKIAFFVTEKISEIEDFTNITDIDPTFFNSGFFYQFKSFLVHAGILVDLGLGTPSNKQYNPKKDLYQLYF